MTGWALVRERARVADTVVAAVAVLLAAACLIPMFVDLSWVLPAIVMVLVVSVVGAGCRALALPLPLVPLAQALGMLVTITAMVAGSEAWARLVPTAEAWDVIRSLLREGLLDAQTYAAPVPTSPGLVLLAVGGVGLVALSTDTLFVSVRSPVLAGLPLLGMYLAAALLPASGAPWWALALPALGWLLILAADQREQVREWANLPGTTRVRGLSTGARRIGVLAIVAASLVAVLLPAGTLAPWRTATADGSGAGTAAEGGPVVLDPLVSMRRSLLQANDTEVLRFTTQAERPSYLRLTVLETFDGTTWRPREGRESGRDAGVPLPGNVLNEFVALDDSNRVRGGDSYTYDISVTNLQNAYLPLPYPVSEITDVDGLGEDWSIDPATGVAFSEEQPATGLDYRVAALDPRIQPGQLRGASAASGDFWPLLNLPGGLSPRIKQLANEVTARAATPYDKAMALQRWFTRDGGFTYSTEVRSGSDSDYLAEFLRERIGYCEQYAATMAIMARTLGIPSRVAVGFTQGTQDEDGTWRVTVRDAHAWPELWFDGVGWARFEPTPRSGGTVLTPDYARVPDGTVAQGGDDNRGVLDNEGFEPVTLDRPRSLPVTAIVGALVLLLAVALCVPMIARIIRRQRRLRARDHTAMVLGAWAEIGDLAVDLGQPWSRYATPRQAADRLSRGMPEHPASALRRIRQEVERVRYAPAINQGTQRASTAEQAEAVREDVRVVMRELRGRVRWQTRVAAYYWPSSERLRQRSSMRSMNPEEGGGAGADGVSVAGASAGRDPKAE